MQPAPFHEVRFPLDIALGASGGPVRRTEVVTLGSGREQRNQRWALSRRRYDAGLGIRTLDDLYAVVEFFEARSGKLHGFRFRDPLDWKSCRPFAQPGMLDQQIGTGDGATRRFQLVKLHAASSQPPRPIRKPVADTVRIAVDGVEVLADTHFQLDAATGIVEFAQAPAEGVQVTGGFEFDIPVRFDTDEIRVSLVAFQAGDVPSIPVVEILA